MPNTAYYYRVSVSGYSFVCALRRGGRIASIRLTQLSLRIVRTQRHRMAPAIAYPSFYWRG